MTRPRSIAPHPRSGRGRLSMLGVVLIASSACNTSTAVLPCRGIRSITLAPPAPTLAIGDSLTLAATYQGPRCGIETPPPGGPWFWSSSNPTIAEVDSRTGVVRARAVGAAGIGVTHRASGATGVTKVQVVQR